MMSCDTVKRPLNGDISEVYSVYLASNLFSGPVWSGARGKEKQQFVRGRKCTVEMTVGLTIRKQTPQLPFVASQMPKGELY